MCIITNNDNWSVTNIIYMHINSNNDNWSVTNIIYMHIKIIEY